MSKSDLRARPIFHHTRDSIKAHLNIVFAALAIGRWLKAATGWSIRKIVKTLRRYRTIQIEINGHTVTTAGPVPADTAELIDNVRRALG